MNSHRCPIWTMVVSLEEEEQLWLRTHRKPRNRVRNHCNRGNRHSTITTPHRCLQPAGGSNPASISALCSFLEPDDMDYGLTSVPPLNTMVHMLEDSCCSIICSLDCGREAMNLEYSRRFPYRSCTPPQASIGQQAPGHLLHKGPRWARRH